MIMIAITFFEFLTYNSFICIACEGSAYFSLDHQKKQESITVRISNKHVGLMSYQKGGQLLDSISADVKIMPLIRIVLAIQFCYNVKYVR